MAKYTKIPESDLAGAMSKSLGSVAGGVSSAAMTKLTKIGNDLQTITIHIDEYTQQSLQAALSPIESSLTSIENSTSTIKKSVNTLKTLRKTLKSPVKPLKAAISVIKKIPAPQMWLVVSVTTVFSDTLEMLSELVAQIEETCEGLEGVESTLGNVLQPIVDMCAQHRKTIAMLKISKVVGEDRKLDENEGDSSSQQGDQSNSGSDSGGNSRVNQNSGAVVSTGQPFRISAEDKQKLTDIGIFDCKGNNLLSKLAQGMCGGVTDVKTLSTGGFVLNYGNSDIDLKDRTTLNKLTAAKIGTGVNVTDEKTGDWITKVYKKSTNKPDVPVSRDPVPDGWSIECLGYGSWYIEATVSGATNKVSTWTSPQMYLGDNNISGNRVDNKTEVDNNKSVKDQVELLRKQIITVLGPKDIEQLNTGKTNNLSGVLKVDTKEASDLLNYLIDKLDVSSVSKECKDFIRDSFKEFHVTVDASSQQKKEYTYQGPDGTVYKMEVVVDVKSPKIAPRRYVQVFNPGGTVVLEGEKSFTTDEEILISEMVVRLSNLIG